MQLPIAAEARRGRRRAASLLGGVAVTVACLGPAVTSAQQDWCKSKYGLADEIGAANLEMPEMGLADAKLVKNYKNYPQAKRQGVEIRKGDVVLFHTGWLKLVGTDDQRYSTGEPGLGKDGAEYLASQQVLAVGPDTWGVETVPFPEGTGV